jgi:polar amino acid transport system substrate-binding protein
MGPASHPPPSQHAYAAPSSAIPGRSTAPTRTTLAVIGGVPLFLARELRNATIVRAPTSPASLEQFRSDNLEVAANGKQPLMAHARANPDARVLRGARVFLIAAPGAMR